MQQPTRLPASAVTRSIDLGDAFKAWLETTEGRSYKEDVSLFRLIAAIADPASIVDTSRIAPAMGAKISAGAAYLRSVAIGDEICPVGNAIAGAIAHAVFALNAPGLLTDERQRNIWGDSSSNLCNEQKFVDAMNAFGTHKFVAGDVTQVGGAILYAATASGGSAQSKMLAAIALASTAGNLDAKKLGEYVAKLTAEGSDFQALEGTSYSAAKQGAQVVRQQQTQAQASA